MGGHRRSCPQLTGGLRQCYSDCPSTAFWFLSEEQELGDPGDIEVHIFFEVIDIRRDSFLPSLSMEIPVSKRTDTQDF